MVERIHEGTFGSSSNLGDNSVYIIGVLGEFEHDDDEEEDDDNMMMTYWTTLELGPRQSNVTSPHA